LSLLVFVAEVSYSTAFVKYVIENVILQGVSAAKFRRSDNFGLAVCYILGKATEISPQI
jgi:hypothetical protein